MATHFCDKGKILEVQYTLHNSNGYGERKLVRVIRDIRVTETQLRELAEGTFDRVKRFELWKFFCN